MRLAEVSDAPIWLLGVDGGGTKTVFLLARSDGSLAAIERGSASYHLDLGVEGVRDVLRQGITTVTTRAGIEPRDIEFAWFGLPAFGESAAVDPLLAALPHDLLGHDRHACDNDMVCAWAGSLGGADGINIVAGTGSIAYGRSASRAARSGGWGELFGDEGSAHWVALKGLALFTRMSDGRAQKGPLHARMRARLSLADDLDILSVLLEGDKSRTTIAGLAPVVADAAIAGDRQARSILERAADELALLADALARKLEHKLGDRISISRSGGMFENEVVRANFHNALARSAFDFVPIEPILPPSWGAIIMAAAGSGRHLTKEAIGRIQAGVQVARAP